MDMAMMTGGAGDAGSEPKDLLFLSFCWHPSRSDTIAITTSAGNVHLVNLGSTEGDNLVLSPEPVITHSLEAWCVAVSQTLKVPALDDGDSYTVLSGGDDSALCYRDFAHATNPGVANLDYIRGDTTVTIKRKHDAGVTAILPLPIEEPGSELILTGSYDDHIRLFSVGPAIDGPGATRVLAERNLGGGVWRLKLVSINNKPEGNTWEATILASCMHGGVRVVKLSKTGAGDYRFHVVGSFVEHKSMNYGSDFQPGETGVLPIVSTSFYDKLLCLWEFSLR
jgi:diphthine methyl ester acylhydrolase